MSKYFPYTISQQLRQSLNKSLSGFFPAMLTQQAFARFISEPWSNAIFAALTVFFSRLGEDNAEKPMPSRAYKLYIWLKQEIVSSIVPSYLLLGKLVLLRIMRKIN